MNIEYPFTEDRGDDRFKYSVFVCAGFLIPFMFVVPYATKSSVALPDFLARLLGSEGEGNMKIAADLLLMTINFCNAFGRVVSGPPLFSVCQF